MNKERTFTPTIENEHLVNDIKRHVVCAANRFPCGLIICGARHWDSVMSEVADRLDIKGGNEEQGFIDQFQNFMTREEANRVATKNGQKLRESMIKGDIAFSENFY